jgi:hypothetical protein
MDIRETGGGAPRTVWGFYTPEQVENAGKTGIYGALRYLYPFG